MLDRTKLVFAWTLYNDVVDWSQWRNPRDTTDELHFQIEMKSRNPSGWYFTVPQYMRNRGWLPEAGGIVICEYSELEFNLWTEPAYNEESILEADPSLR